MCAFDLDLGPADQYVCSEVTSVDVIPGASFNFSRNANTFPVKVLEVAQSGFKRILIRYKYRSKTVSKKGSKFLASQCSEIREFDFENGISFTDAR